MFLERCRRILAKMEAACVARYPCRATRSHGSSTRFPSSSSRVSARPITAGSRFDDLGRSGPEGLQQCVRQPGLRHYCRYLHQRQDAVR